MTVPFAVMGLMILLVMGMNRFPMTSAAAPPSGIPTTTTSQLLSNQDNLKGDLLEGQLVTGATEEFHGTARRLMGRSQLDPDRLLREMGKGLLHLPVENEGDIGIELFLKLIELHLSMFPGSGFKHRHHEDVLAGVMGKRIEHACALDARVGRRAILAG